MVLRFEPVLVEKPWGGRSLADLGRELPAEVAVGESWDIADLTADQTSQPDPVSRIVGGPHDGRSLGEVIATDRDWLLGSARPTADGRFPLLVKVLDAAQHLSVQVHPTPNTVGPGEHLKTESWVVLSAEPGAVLYVGLRDGVTRDEFVAAAGTPAIVDVLAKVHVGVGDVVHLPTGTVHALGAGVVVAEVQTASDTTYRLHDWTDLYGRAPRELHVASATLAALDAWESNIGPVGRPEGDGLLVDEAAYRLLRHTLADGERVRLDLPQPAVVVVLDGTPSVCGEVLERGAVRLVPAAEALDVSGPGQVLEALAG